MALTSQHSLVLQTALGSWQIHSLYCSAPRILIRAVDRRLPHVLEGMAHARKYPHHPGNELCTSSFRYVAHNTSVPDEDRGCALGILALSRACTLLNNRRTFLLKGHPTPRGAGLAKSFAPARRTDPVCRLFRGVTSTGFAGVCLSTTRESAVPTMPICTQ